MVSGLGLAAMLTKRSALVAPEITFSKESAKAPRPWVKANKRLVTRLIFSSKTATFGRPVAGPRKDHELPPSMLFQTAKSVPTNTVWSSCGSKTTVLWGMFTGVLTFLQFGVEERAFV